MNKTIRNFITLLLIFAAVVFVLGCAGGSKALLAEDYKKMGNENLLR